MDSIPKGTIIYSTVGRTQYGFDVFSVNLESSSEKRLTDGISVNFNAQFVDDSQTIVFISERTGSSQIYLTSFSASEPLQHVETTLTSLFHDRPLVSGDRVYFVSAHEQPADSLYKSWSAVYSAPLNSSRSDSSNVTRLTPMDVVDYSPAISQSGQYIAVASYGSKHWAGDFQELQTEIIVFPVSDPTDRTVVANQGGWPTWYGDNTIYFHRQSDDGWWSIYRFDFPSTASNSAQRVTPPGVHAFTPAAFHHANKIAVATRRKDRPYRHIEIYDLESKEFQPVTEKLNPKTHHYNPFVSPGSKFLGYHRFRGESTGKSQIIPNLEQVSSPVKSLKLLRVNGNFPEVSPDGNLVAYNPDFEHNIGIKITKLDGSKGWNLIKGRVAFYNSWCPADKNVIFTSLGGIFQPADVTVQVARVSFDASALDPHRPDVENVQVKILTKESTGNNAFPACSPDGKVVVFRSGRSGNKNLYIMDAANGELDGGFIQQLTDGAWTDTMPSWSPDGKWIAFSSNRHDPCNAVTFGIYMVRPDGSDLRRVHAEGLSPADMERINHVCFSPNGEWLLFTANMAGVTAEPVSFPNQFQPYGELFVVRVDGSGLRRLTCNAYENGTPIWHSGEGFEVDLKGNQDGDELKGQFQEPLWLTCPV